jgi:hypothetical protein
VTEHDHAVGGVDGSPIGRDIGGMQGLGLDPGLAQYPGAVVRGVPARANPDQSNAAPAKRLAAASAGASSASRRASSPGGEIMASRISDMAQLSS